MNVKLGLSEKELGLAVNEELRLSESSANKKKFLETPTMVMSSIWKIGYIIYKFLVYSNTFQNKKKLN